ncbi:MAG TPA: HAD hydrolase family protein [Gemmatimonadaceae bacterium]
MRPSALREPWPRIALFSDVDGTLLDARDRFALTPDEVLRMAPDVELILSSSRTVAELAVLQRRLGLAGPLIAENGAVIAFPARWRGSASTRREVVPLGQPAVGLVPRIHRCAERVGVSVVNQKRLLPDGGRSLRRGYSVCLLDWPGPSAERFIRCLAREGLEGSRSGTWITITSGPHKGTGVRAILARARELGAPFTRVVAVGNAANDRPLLAAARTRFVIRNPRMGHDADLVDLPGVTLLRTSGRRAWRDLLDHTLRRP